MQQKRSSESVFWILTALASGRLHGYAIIKEATRLSNGGFALRPTTLYAALDRLESDGLIMNDGEDTIDGRHRSYFILTPAGHDLLLWEVEDMEARAHVARQQIQARRAPKLGII